MTAAPRRRAFRRVVQALALSVSAFVLIAGGVLALYVSRPESGVGHDILDVIETPFDHDQTLRYNAHLALGKLFSLCPCTAGLSSDQYRRAAFHRPRATNAP